MNTKEKLIEELNKDSWIIDTYGNYDRYYELMYIIPDNQIWRSSNSVCTYVPLYSCRYIRCENSSLHLGTCDEHGYQNLTQLFNNYLEKHEPSIWMHSLLAAHHLGLKIERYTQERSLPVWTKWIPADTSIFVIDIDERYRIDFDPEPETMVPDEIWDILDEDVVAITKNRDKNITFHINMPIIDNNIKFWHSTGAKLLPSEIKCMQNAKIHGVDWKDSLCVRPTK